MWYIEFSSGNRILLCFEGVYSYIGGSSISFLVEASLILCCFCFCGSIGPLVVVLFILLWHWSLGDVVPPLTVALLFWLLCCVVWLLQCNFYVFKFDILSF